MLKIGIVIYSQTENTYSVGQKLEEKLLEDGHDVKLERILPAGEVHPGSKDITFKTLPELDEYEAIIFGSPVHAFSLAPAMKAYMEQIPSLQDKNIACYVTKGVPLKWTGGTQAIAKMKKICTSKGGKIVGTGIIVWNKKRDKEIGRLVEKFSAMF